MPRLWNDTIAAHRRAVSQAILDTTAALVAQHGLLSVSMSQIAEESGIGRATLYKYFPDLEAILAAWHQQQVAAHLQQLAAIGVRHAHPRERLAAVLEAYALIQHQRVRHHDHQPHGRELTAFLHSDDDLGAAQDQLRGLIRGLLVDAVATGDVRGDIDPDELTGYCLHALAAAAGMPSMAAVRRLVAVTLDGLHT